MTRAIYRIGPAYSYGELPLATHQHVEIVGYVEASGRYTPAPVSQPSADVLRDLVPGIRLPGPAPVRPAWNPDKRYTRWLMRAGLLAA